MAPEDLARRIKEAQLRLQPLVPDVGPDDLFMIIHSLLVPITEKTFFLRMRPDGRYGI